MAIRTNESYLSEIGMPNGAYVRVEYDDVTELVQGVSIENTSSLTCEYNVFGLNSGASVPLITYSASPGQTRSWTLNGSQRYNINDYSVGMRFV